MRFEGRFDRRHVLLLCAFLVTAVLSMQLVAATAWTADDANAGPGVTIIQLSQDSDSDWATQDLINRLSKFIHDDPFFPNRISVIKTDDPHVAQSVTDGIIIYVSHGGPLGIVTGSRITAWKTMAQIIDDSVATIHLFTSCSSRNIIRHGDQDSGKKLYTVPGARPAEVTNVEIVTTIMLAFGFDEDAASQYREEELTKAKELIESGKSVHVMDFEEIILNEIETIDDTYNSTYTEDSMVYREAVVQTYFSPADFYLLPADLRAEIEHYYRFYVDIDGVETVRQLGVLHITYTKNYYINSSYVPGGGESLPPDWLEYDLQSSGLFSEFYTTALYITGGQWVNSTPVFTGGTYSGWLKYTGDGHEFLQVVVNVTASGPTLDGNNVTLVDSIALSQIDAGGTYIQKQKVDEVWQEPIVGRNPKRTGGSWTDPCTKADYEYESTWPPFPGATTSTGSIHSTGDYIYVNSIPTGTGWHGPSFVRTLPSYFRIGDMGSISTNLSIYHEVDEGQVSLTSVSLYDDRMRIVLYLRVVDFWPSIYVSDQREAFEARYYFEDGTTSASLSSPTIYGDSSGIVQIRYDPHQGIYANVPEMNETRLFKWTDINTDRIVKYIVIQSCRSSSYMMNDAHIDNVQLNYAASDYTVFHDNCNDMDNFHKDLDFGYGTVSDGNFTVPSGQSYMTPTDIPASPTGWHGPNFVHVLDRPFRLCQLSEFSVVGELVQSLSTMGKTFVGLFDEKKQIVMEIGWGDSWVGSKKGYFYTYYMQNGTSYTQYPEYIYSSFMKTGKLWWGSYPGDEGSIFSSIGGVMVRLGECDNASRVIQYVVLTGQRYSHYALVEMRIHDINVVADLKWSQRAVTLLDSCHDMDNFECDPDFNWGVVTTGEIVVPPGTEYMTPTGIPSSPPGWHGPNYVHEFENPFILHDLRLFYIQSELIQQYRSLGKMYVALFDVNMNIVLSIHWGDDLIESYRGYFHVVYYPEGGSPTSDTTGYISSSFWRMGELKVENEHITYKIKDLSSTIQSGDLGAVANPFRQIKYLAIRAERYSSYNLIGLRLHAIGLYAGQDTSVPEPEEADGASSGYSPSPAAVSFVDMLIAIAIAGTISWWTGWWPVLHSRTTGTLESGATYAYQMAVDLLGNTVLEDFAVDTPVDDHLTDGQITLMAQTGVLDLFAEAFTVDAAILWGAAIVMGAIDILLALVTKLPTPPQLALLAVLVIAYTLAMFLGLAALWDGVLSGRVSASAAFGILVLTLSTLIIEGIIAGINGWFIFKEWWNHYTQAGKNLLARRFCFMSWVIFCVKMMFIAIILGMLVRVYGFWIQGY